MQTIMVRKEPRFGVENVVWTICHQRHQVLFVLGEGTRGAKVNHQQAMAVTESLRRRQYERLTTEPVDEVLESLWRCLSLAISSVVHRPGVIALAIRNKHAHTHGTTRTGRGGAPQGAHAHTWACKVGRPECRPAAGRPGLVPAGVGALPRAPRAAAGRGASKKKSDLHPAGGAAHTHTQHHEGARLHRGKVSKPARIPDYHQGLPSQPLCTHAFPAQGWGFLVLGVLTFLPGASEGQRKSKLHYIKCVANAPQSPSNPPPDRQLSARIMQQGQGRGWCNFTRH